MGLKDFICDSRPGERASKMLDGTMAGMVTGSQLTEELARKREADRKRIAALDSSVTGRYAKTVGSCAAMLSLLRNCCTPESCPCVVLLRSVS